MNQTRAGRRWTLRLFPHRWRERYGEEFLALIDDRPPGLRDTLDIVVSAVDARIRPRAWGLAETMSSPVLMTTTPDPPPSQITVGQSHSTPTERRLDAERRFTRREFLRDAVLGGVGVSAVVGSIALVQYGISNQTGAFGKEVIVPPNVIPAPGDPPYKYLPGKFWLINNDDGALALYWKCPHLGCTVPWEPTEAQFHCPCHQSIYDRHGVLVSGPAPRPMDVMALRVDQMGNVLVHTGQITERDHYDPSQAVRLDQG